MMMNESTNPPNLIAIDPKTIDNEFHATNCRCDDCLDWLHSHHFDQRTGDPDIDTRCPLCLPPDSTRVSQTPIIQTMTCYLCDNQPERRVTGKTTIIDNADPTTAYELECRHYAI